MTAILQLLSPRRLRLFVFGLALSLTGCATAAAGGEGGAEAVTVVVENNLIPPTSLTVYAVEENGGRRLIGTVNPSGTATLSFEPTFAAARYYFAAETTSGADIVSNPLTLANVERVQWDVQANIATVVQE